MASQVQQAGQPLLFLHTWNNLLLYCHMSHISPGVVTHIAYMRLQRLLSSTRGPRLSEDAFEGVIDSFEKGLHHILEQRTELWPNVIEASREAPDIESIFPVEEACNLVVSLCC